MGRAISDDFKKDLLEGKLSNLLEAVHNDNTLIMELRGDSVIIYYRGGALYTITSIETGYNIAFNMAYCAKKKLYLEIEENPSIENAVKYIAFYKHQMDFHRANADRELEKQGQQQLILENNILGGKKQGEKTDISKSSTGDYYVLDMEYAYKASGIEARFDTVAVHWPSLGNRRKSGKNLGISFLELKYFDGAMGNKSGIGKHISDFVKFTTDEKYKKAYINMCKDMETVFKQKCELGLLPAYTSRLNMENPKYSTITIDPNKTELIFVFINRDPDSSVAARELHKCYLKYGKEKLSNVYMATSSDVGYMLFRYGDNCKQDRYITLTDYIKSYGYEVE